ENITKDNTIQVRMWLYDEYEVEEYEFEFKADYLADSKTNITELTIPYKEVDIVTHNITDEEGKPKLPIIKIPNNKFELGDYEPHLSLIDAYNDLVSGNMEDLADFTDALLKLVNLNETNSDDL
ncbi:portal protein, partial [Bacillus cereus]|uniref:phage portal protein n=1 Tax=Bacillus cereus TaxID=1396 RepID=UPI000C028E62